MTANTADALATMLLEFWRQMPEGNSHGQIQSFKQFQNEYPDDESCLAKLMEINYGGTEIVCPGCKKRANFHPMSKRRAYACQECGHHVYPAAGTIFHKSRTNLTKWFFAMYLMTSTRHGGGRQKS